MSAERSNTMRTRRERDLTHGLHGARALAVVVLLAPAQSGCDPTSGSPQPAARSTSARATASSTAPAEEPLGAHQPLLAMPFRAGTVAYCRQGNLSGFGRSHGVSDALNRFALDFALLGQTEATVVAAASGRVVQVERAPARAGRYGAFVFVDHGHGWGTLYAHLARIDVDVDTSVGQGQALGSIAGHDGATASGMLHFALHRVVASPTTHAGTGPAPTATASASATTAAASAASATAFAQSARSGPRAPNALAAFIGSSAHAEFVIMAEANEGQPIRVRAFDSMRALFCDEGRVDGTGHLYASVTGEDGLHADPGRALVSTIAKARDSALASLRALPAAIWRRVASTGPNEARKRLEALVKRKADDWDAWYHLGLVLEVHLHDSVGARKAFDEVARAGAKARPEVVAWSRLRLAALDWRTGERARARAAVRALPRDVRDREYRAFLEELEAKIGAP